MEVNGEHLMENEVEQLNAARQGFTLPAPESGWYTCLKKIRVSINS